MEKTSTGMQANIAGPLCYLLGWLTGIVFIIIEKENPFVRFHAMQSIFVFGALTVIMIILSFIPFIGWILGIFLYIAAFILWILLMLKAYKGEMYKVPVFGNLAEKQVH